MKIKLEIEYVNQSASGEMFLNYFLFDALRIDHLDNQKKLPIAKSLSDLIYKVRKFDTEESQKKEAAKLLHKLFELKLKKFVRMISQSDRENFYDFFDKNNIDPLHSFFAREEDRNEFVLKEKLSREIILFIKQNYINAFVEIPFRTMELSRYQYKKMVKHYSYTI